MASNYGESASTSGSNNNNSEAGSFECNICFELAQDPIVTLCGHLYCWPCLYKWLRVHSHSPECPVCKAIVEEDKLVPLYGRGKNPTDPRSKSVPGVNIPNRPAGQRPLRPPLRPEPLRSTEPMVHGLPDAAAYGPGAGFPYGYGHSFHGGHGHAYPRHAAQGGPQQQQADVYLKALLILVGMLVVASLVAF
uniref:E3 ubiquitin-protein ligase RMA n=1 Tax=Ananas comosus var. bracteatus TaxID=296719 RepID=A0A6V7PCH7_ANACO|nr:unnamed protein product [Ananas comosus var. bracteatus]